MKNLNSVELLKLDSLKLNSNWRAQKELVKLSVFDGHNLFQFVFDKTSFEVKRLMSNDDVYSQIHGALYDLTEVIIE